MRSEEGAAWDELTLKMGYKEALKNNDIQPFTKFENYKKAADYIRSNAQLNPKSAETVLVDSMTILEKVNTRLKKESRNVNYKGIDLDTANNALMDLLSGKGDTNSTAGEMMKSIDDAIASGKLLPEEAAALEDVKAEIKPYVDNIKGNMLQSEGDSSIDIDIKRIAPQLKTEKDTAYFWSGNSNSIGGENFAIEYAQKHGGTTQEGLMQSKGIDMPIWDISNPNAIKAGGCICCVCG